jgi:hypothetical protein
MPTLSDKAQTFLANNPYYIGAVAGHKFYEHPTRGDESPLFVIGPDGKLKLSDHWEIPSVEELLA